MDVLHRKTTFGKLVHPASGSRLGHRRTPVERLVKQVKDVDVPEVHPPKAMKSGLVAVGGLIGLTAGSAAVSARRRRSEGSRNEK